MQCCLLLCQNYGVSISIKMLNNFFFSLFNKFLQTFFLIEKISLDLKHFWKFLLWGENMCIINEKKKSIEFVINDQNIQFFFLKYSGMKFRCASIECPEVFNGPKLECIYQSQFDRCCGKYECSKRIEVFCFKPIYKYMNFQ